MMPMMKLRSADEYPQRADGQADVRVDVDGPEAAKGKQPRQGFQAEPHDEGGQVDEPHRVNCVQRMLAMRGEPVQMFGAVMNRMKTPEKADPMLQTMPPVNQQIAKENDFGCLQSPRLRSDHRPK